MDDERIVRTFAARVLRDAGYGVREARDGAEAWELARREGQELDAVLSDVVMPRLNGVELFQRLAQFRPELPVLLMSGYGSAQLELQGINAPCGLIGKPFSPQQLLEEMRRCLESRT